MTEENVLAISAAVAREVHVLYTVTASLSTFSFKIRKMHSQRSICFNYTLSFISSAGPDL